MEPREDQTDKKGKFANKLFDMNGLGADWHNHPVQYLPDSEEDINKELNDKLNADFAAGKWMSDADRAKHKLDAETAAKAKEQADYEKRIYGDHQPTDVTDYEHPEFGDNPPPGHDSHRGMVVPGYNYLGPGNGLNRGAPVNHNDALALEHDKGYDTMVKQGKNPYLTWSDHDQTFWDGLQNDGTAGYYLSDAFFSLKKQIAPMDPNAPGTSTDTDGAPPAKVPRPGTSTDASAGVSPTSSLGGGGSGGGGGQGDMPMENYAFWKGDDCFTVSTRQFNFRNTANANPYSVFQAKTSATPPVDMDFFVVNTDWNYIDFNAIEGHFPHKDLQRLYRTAGFSVGSVEIEMEHTMTLVHNNIGGSDIASAFGPAQLEWCLRGADQLPYCMAGEKHLWTTDTAVDIQYSPWKQVTFGPSEVMKYCYKTSENMAMPSTAPADQRPNKITYFVEHGKVNHLPVGGKTGYQWQLNTTTLDNYCLNAHIMDHIIPVGATNQAAANSARWNLQDKTRPRPWIVTASRPGDPNAFVPNSARCTSTGNSLFRTMGGNNNGTATNTVNSESTQTPYMAVWSTSQTNANGTGNDASYSNQPGGVQPTYTQWLRGARMFQWQPKHIKHKITSGTKSPILHGAPPPLMLFRQRPVPNGNLADSFLNLTTLVTVKCKVHWKTVNAFNHQQGWSGYNIAHIDNGGIAWEASGTDGETAIVLANPILPPNPNYCYGPVRSLF